MQHFNPVNLLFTPSNLMYQAPTSPTQEIEMPIHSNIIPYFPPLLPQVALAHIMPDNFQYQAQTSFTQGIETQYLLYPVTYLPSLLPQVAFAQFSASPVITNLTDQSNNSDIPQFSSQLTSGTHLSKRRRAETQNIENNTQRKIYKYDVISDTKNKIDNQANIEFGHKAIDEDGSVYQGGWKDGKKHGQGKFTTLKGKVYTGNWEEGKKDGYGKVTLNGKIVYDGYWKEGKKDRHGKKTYSDGSVYVGNWKEGLLDGRGKLTS